jgi:hypothetical protein
VSKVGADVDTLVRHKPELASSSHPIELCLDHSATFEAFTDDVDVVADARIEAQVRIDEPAEQFGTVCSTYEVDDGYCVHSLVDVGDAVVVSESVGK